MTIPEKNPNIDICFENRSEKIRFYAVISYVTVVGHVRVIKIPVL